MSESVRVNACCKAFMKANWGYSKPALLLQTCLWVLTAVVASGPPGLQPLSLGGYGTSYAIAVAVSGTIAYPKSATRSFARNARQIARHQTQASTGFCVPVKAEMKMEKRPDLPSEILPRQCRTLPGVRCASYPLARCRLQPAVSPTSVRPPPGNRNPVIQPLLPI
jgi:hypothetical protein